MNMSVCNSRSTHPIGYHTLRVIFTQEFTQSGVPANDDRKSFSESVSTRKEQCISHQTKRVFYYLLNVMALLCQAGGIVFVGMMNVEFTNSYNASLNETVETSNIHFRSFDRSNKPSTESQWLFPLVLLLKSLTWWENFIDSNLKFKDYVLIPFREWKVRMYKVRQKSTAIVCLWNCAIIIVFPLVAKFLPSSSLADFNYALPATNGVDSFSTITLLSVPLANLFSGIVGFWVGALVCKLLMQKICFNLPLMIGTPLTGGLVIFLCKRETNILKHTYSWQCLENFSVISNNLNDLSWQLVCFALFWLSLLIVVCYLWRPKENPMDRTEK